MRAQDEQKDLVQNPLPVEPAKATDDYLPSLIHDLDEQIAKFYSYIEDLMIKRDEMLKRAIEIRRLSDNSYMIVPREKNLPRVVNMIAFQTQYPVEYDKAIAIERKKRLDAATMLMAHVDDPIDKILIKTAEDALPSKRMVDDVCYPHEVKVTYEIMKRTPELKEE